MTGKFPSGDIADAAAPPVPTAEMNFQLVLEDMADRGWEQADLVRSARARGIALNANRVDRFIRGTHRTKPTWKLIAKALGRKLSRYVVRSAAA